jgi:hypothetical protein
MGEALVAGDEVAADHREDETTVVAYVLAVVQRVEHVAHHRALAQVFYRHESAPLISVRQNYTVHPRSERETDY